MHSKEKIKKITLTLVVLTGVFLLLSIVGFFSFRNVILKKVIDKVTVKVNTNYHASFKIKDAKFKGFNTIQVSDISVVPDGFDTLVYIQQLQTSVDLWHLLFKDIRLNELEVNSGYLNLVNDERGKNINVFIKAKDSSQVETITTKSDDNLAKSSYKLIRKVLSFLPFEVTIQNVSLHLRDFNQKIETKINDLTLNNQLVNATIGVQSINLSTQEYTHPQTWLVSGTADPRKQKADLRIFTKDTGNIVLPYLQERFNLVTGFDSIRLKLDNIDLTGGELEIKGLASISNFMVNHPKISKKDVEINKAEFDYSLRVGSNFIAIDSTSTIVFNQLVFHPFIKYQRSPNKTFQLNIVTGNVLAQDFINSLPEGLFNHFKGMEAEGSFSYRLDFFYDESNPRDLVFESSLSKDGLRITKYGEANLGKLNTDFVYTPIENGKPQRSILVSTENPDFYTLDEISPLLRKTVLTTEDPSFFYHRGFIDEAFRQSIIKNIRQKKFARGASTISMQLIKNVFLTREKTLSRKLEEILLVYILENNRLSSKERMFDVYLNIIEWGPNVYGIGEASRFYFEKEPYALTLSESMFLATIIPSPKKFMWRFGKDGKLKDYIGRHFTSLGGLMIRRNVLTPEDTIGLTHHINISGLAKKYIKIAPDSIEEDSINIDENGVLIHKDDE